MAGSSSSTCSASTVKGFERSRRDAVTTVSEWMCTGQFTVSESAAVIVRVVRSTVSE